MTTVGDIDSTSGAAIGQGNQAQNTTVNVAGLSNRDLMIEVFDRVNTLALQIERISAKLEYVTDRTATALVGVEGRMYQMSKTAERQQAHDEQDRHSGQAEHTEQHEEVNRRLASLEELVRNDAYQSRMDRMLIGAAIALLFLATIGNTVGWW